MLVAAINAPETATDAQRQKEFLFTGIPPARHEYDDEDENNGSHQPGQQRGSAERRTLSAKGHEEQSLPGQEERTKLH